MAEKDSKQPKNLSNEKKQLKQTPEKGFVIEQFTKQSKSNQDGKKVKKPPIL